jgi:hypothetical protein
MSRLSSAKRSKNSGFRLGTARKRRRVAMGAAGALIALAAVIAVSTQRPFIAGALAQTEIQSSHDPALHLGHEPAAEAPEPLFDGTVRPEDIPDSVAISVLMNSLRIPNDSDATALGQLQAKVRRVNLGEGDFAILVSELVDFDTAARVQEARIAAVRPSSAPGISAASARFLEDRYVEERRNLGTLAEDRYAQLLESLSPDGTARLEEHLLHVKTRIRIFAPPDMAKRTL